MAIGKIARVTFVRIRGRIVPIKSKSIRKAITAPSRTIRLINRITSGRGSKGFSVRNILGRTFATSSFISRKLTRSSSERFLDKGLKFGVSIKQLRRAAQVRIAADSALKRNKIFRRSVQIVAIGGIINASQK